MKVLVIPDIHLKPWIFDKADELLEKGKADRAVCLMDIPDDWGMELHIDLYEKTYDRAISFAVKYPDTLWCYGNHDISYVWCKQETGFSVYAEAAVRSKIRELDEIVPDSNIAIIHRIDKVLFTHGGLTAQFVESLNIKSDADIDTVIAAVNDAPSDILWNDSSPLWFRPQYKDVPMYRNDEFVQVVGHTPVKNIDKKNSVISTDVFSTYRDGRQIGESVMIVIETLTGEYEKVMII